MNKTYEMLVRGRTSIPLPSCIPSIKRKTWLKILGITLEEIPENWDRHFEEMLKKASGRMYISWKKILDDENNALRTFTQQIKWNFKAKGT